MPSVFTRGYAILTIGAIGLFVAGSLLGIWPSQTPAVAQTSGYDIVSEIVVEGTQRIDPATVRSNMSVRAGQSLTAEQLDQSLKALFATGLFADVTIRRQGDVLVVTVVENPVINRIAFEGNRRIEDTELTNEIDLKPRRVFTRTRVQQDVQRVMDIYRRSGRYSVTVEPKIIQQPQNRVDLVFEIDEGALTPVQVINFIGNKRFSDSTLRGEIATKEYAFYRILSSDDTYDPDRLSFDRERLRQFYLENGYADFQVLSAVAELSPDRQSFAVTFTVEEGQRYSFGASTFDVALPRVTEDALVPLIAYEQGDIYNANEVDATVDAITDYLGTLGYAFVSVRPRPNRDREANVIDLEFQIGEGARVFVERVDIIGNVRTLDRVIRREMSLVEGDAFNTTQLRRSERRIRNLGFFKSIDVRNTEGSTPDRTLVVVEVEEQPTGEISFGVGFSTVESVIGDVAIRERNLLGRGQDLRFGISGSASSTEFDISFTEPYFLERDVAAGFDLFRVEREQESSSFDELRVGGVLRAAYDLAPDLRQSVNYTLKQTEIKDVDEDASRFIKDQEGARLVSQVGQSLTYDKRDNRLDPRSGYYIQLSNDVAGLGGDERFLRTRLRGGYYYPITDEWNFAVFAQAGNIVGIGEDVNIAERFFVGGNNFRGFERDGVGPRDLTTDDALGGNKYYVGTAEVTFPNGLPDDLGVRTFLFTDVGSLWDVEASGTDIADDNAIRASVGLGLSFTTAFGQIRVDAAQAVLKEDYDETELFRFSFGTRF